MEKQKVLVLIDNMAPGGSQRQVYYLVSLLKQEYRVRLLTYYQYTKDFYKDRLLAKGVDYQKIHAEGKIYQLFKVFKQVKKFKPDVVVSFLYNANQIACLLKPFFPGLKLIISDRGKAEEKLQLKDFIRLNIYRLADYLVINNIHSKGTLQKTAPWLASKVRVIFNMIDFEKFYPQKSETNHKKKQLTILIAANYSPVKNIHNLIEGVQLFTSNYSSNILIKWYGNKHEEIEAKYAYYKKAIALIEKYQLNENCQFHGPIEDMRSEIHNADIVGLPSKREGSSNFVIEGMACGKPIWVGNIGDHNYLIKQNRGGVLFEPNNPESIAQSLGKLASLNRNQLKEMGEFNAQRAKNLFSFQGRYQAFKNLIN